MAEIMKGKCGTDCNMCSFKEKFHCKGCNEQDGKIFWGECDIYKCATASNFQHCGECEKLPCKDLIEYINNGHNPDRLSNLNKWKNELRFFKETACGRFRRRSKPSPSGEGGGPKG